METRRPTDEELHGDAFLPPGSVADLSEAAEDDRQSSAAPMPANPSMLRFVFFGRDGLRAGWSLLLFFGIASGLGWIISTLLHRFSHAHPQPGHPQPPGVAILTEGISLLVVFAATWALSRIERRPLRRYGLGATPGALRQFLVGLLWGGLLLAGLVCMLWLAHLLVFTGVLLSGIALLRFAVEWAIGFLLVGLFEEYLLRGFLQFTLARGIAGALRATTDSTDAGAIGFWIAAALLSLLFGLGHGSNPGESPIGLLSAGLIGMVFCLSLWRTGSLWWAVGFHAAWDFSQSFLFGVADSGTFVQGHLLASHPQGRPLLSGGSTGPEGSIFILLIVLATIAVILLTLPSTRREADAPAPETLADVEPR